MKGINAPLSLLPHLVPNRSKQNFDIYKVYSIETDCVRPLKPLFPPKCCSETPKACGGVENFGGISLNGCAIIMITGSQARSQEMDFASASLSSTWGKKAKVRFR